MLGHEYIEVGQVLKYLGLVIFVLSITIRIIIRVRAKKLDDLALETYKEELYDMVHRRSNKKSVLSEIGETELYTETFNEITEKYEA